MKREKRRMSLFEEWESDNDNDNDEMKMKEHVYTIEKIERKIYM